jgi:hypothetical protein
MSAPKPVKITMIEQFKNLAEKRKKAKENAPKMPNQTPYQNKKNRESK